MAMTKVAAGLLSAATFRWPGVTRTNESREPACQFRLGEQNECRRSAREVLGTFVHSWRCSACRCGSRARALVETMIRALSVVPQGAVPPRRAGRPAPARLPAAAQAAHPDREHPRPAARVSQDRRAAAWESAAQRWRARPREV